MITDNLIFINFLVYFIILTAGLLAVYLSLKLLLLLYYIIMYNPVDRIIGETASSITKRRFLTAILQNDDVDRR